MMDIITSIADFFLSIGQLILNTFQSIAWIVSSIPTFTSSITAVFAYCPSFLLVFLEVSLALTIVFAIIKLL